jgi:hypothetical protein
MQATIYFELSSAGQRDALRRGLPAAERQTVISEIEERDLALAEIREDGTVHIDTDRQFPYQAFAFDTYPEPRSILDAMHERLAKQQAEDDEAVAQAIREYDAEVAKAQADLQYIPTTSRPVLKDTLKPRVASHPIWELYYERNEQAKARREAQRLAEQRAQQEKAAAKEAAKQAAIAAWVAEHGTPSQKARLADGMLCRDEIVSAIAKYVLDPIGPPEEKPVICDDNGHKYGREETTCLGEAEYSAWQALKARLPEGSTWSFERVTPCTREDDYGDDGDGLGAPYATATVTVPYGPFRFTRTIVLR